MNVKANSIYICLCMYAKIFISPEFCSQAKGHCGVVAVAVTIEPIQLSDSTFPFERYLVVTMELFCGIQMKV